jgi:large subunit ribosomal protein L32
MAVPKGKISKARGRKRRTHWKLSLPGIVKCPRCQQMKLSHRVCKHCGYYDGKQVIVMDDDTKKKKEKEA